jgi:hypothetical protein
MNPENSFKIHKNAYLTKQTFIVFHKWQKQLPHVPTYHNADITTMQTVVNNSAIKKVAWL